MKNYLVTGAAGFIGSHVSRRLLARGDRVVGIDNLNDYYSPLLKEARLSELAKYSTFTFHKCNIANLDGLTSAFGENEYDVVVHLAAQAGVRYSIENPHAYAESNLVGFLNILEQCRQKKISHLLYASSSSVYGGNRKQPFSVEDPVNNPVSLYAATKRANELMAHTYSHLYSFYTTGLRFFTVYGPWGRPDMAIYSFADAIMAGKPIRVFNHGKMRRDFTFIDDAAQAVVRLIDKKPTPNLALAEDSLYPGSPYSCVHNLGNHHPVELEVMIGTLEKHLGTKAIRQYVDMQPGDVKETYADATDLQEAVGFSPSTTIDEGIAKFVDWYLRYQDSLKGALVTDSPSNCSESPLPTS